MKDSDTSQSSSELLTRGAGRRSGKLINCRYCAFIIIETFTCFLDVNHCVYLGQYLRKRRELLWPQSLVAIPTDKPMNGAQVPIGHDSSFSGRPPLLGYDPWPRSRSLMLMLVYKRWKAILKTQFLLSGISQSSVFLV